MLIGFHRLEMNRLEIIQGTTNPSAILRGIPISIARLFPKNYLRVDLQKHGVGDAPIVHGNIHHGMLLDEAHPHEMLQVVSFVQ